MSLHTSSMDFDFSYLGKCQICGEVETGNSLGTEIVVYKYPYSPGENYWICEQCKEQYFKSRR